MKKNLLALGVVLCAQPFSTAQANEEFRLYLERQKLITNEILKEWQAGIKVGVGIPMDDNYETGTSLELFVAKTISDQITMDVRYHDFGEYDLDTSFALDSGINLSTTGFGVGLSAYNQVESLDVMFSSRLGLVSWDSEVNLTGAGSATVDDGLGLVLSFGGERVFENKSVGAELSLTPGIVAEEAVISISVMVKTFFE